ncbi:hypothetical protein [Ralstonia solanacearum]|uniref:Uncharacterized protein n=2 Tax=Ralstonia solanacearum TaxID=305 RepID=A0A7X0UIX1_RALSL|nr:hypothetical protein [Ralstonia solanacearum]KFX78042.1 hypothetical protein KR98_15865 [Ralstonia solanacearum]MBB6581914.1 hypothetical protein [Ralstonia solanacearum]MBB6584717.1 hypothetical protein [Ralstonia solanacearum]MDB0524548.1 hypothetical protein [Ralstonia solanacearum]OCQ62072.1 hypothetical protein AR465_16810 [Ralstonia solanacearum]
MSDSVLAITDFLKSIGEKLSGMVIERTLDVEVTRGREKPVCLRTPVEFRHDKNWPKIVIFELDDIGFHVEYSTRHQEFTFERSRGCLAISGESSGTAYKLRISEI